MLINAATPTLDQTRALFFPGERVGGAGGAGAGWESYRQSSSDRALWIRLLAFVSQIARCHLGPRTPPGGSGLRDRSAQKRVKEENIENIFQRGKKKLPLTFDGSSCGGSAASASSR